LLDGIDLHLEVPQVKFREKSFCQLDERTRELLKNAMTEFNFSARAYDRILQVARTIADLAGLENITGDHIGEAVQYRFLDRQLWG